MSEFFERYETDLMDSSSNEGDTFEDETFYYQ